MDEHPEQEEEKKEEPEKKQPEKEEPEEKKKLEGEAKGEVKEEPEVGKQYKIGDKVPGNVAPSGGSWKYNAEQDEMELVEEPTQKT